MVHGDSYKVMHGPDEAHMHVGHEYARICIQLERGSWRLEKQLETARCGAKVRLRVKVWRV